ncbi:hypothetical protein TRVL_09610 [Trypanosoma vivax]|nr:hypothetical protein TRVL_09610 [Trypanosoma vivax]
MGKRKGLRGTRPTRIYVASGGTTAYCRKERRKGLPTSPHVLGFCHVQQCNRLNMLSRPSVIKVSPLPLSQFATGLSHCLPEQDGELPPRNINVSLCFVCDKGTKVLPNNTVPYALVLFLELPFNKRRHAVLQRLCFEGLNDKVLRLLLHLLCHIGINVEFVVF